MKLNTISILAGFAIACTATAQTTIGFETEDFKKLGVYDTWEESPFRTGALQGNFAIVDNPYTKVEEILGEAPNASGKVLAVQRSRFGSNTFGARIDLNETFELTSEAQYLHVMVHRPYASRVMVVGLGKRSDRKGQSPETEQFWAMSTTDIQGGRWEDVVFPIKGAGGIDIHSLVVVPDCESPHNYTTDAICYIDNVEVNDNPAPKFSYAFYPICFSEEQLHTNNGQHVEKISLYSPSDGRQSYAIPDSHGHMYHCITEKTFTAKAGEAVMPTLENGDGRMHGYVYIDTDNDGKFNDVTSRDSAITLPAKLENGYYRMRYKADGNNTNASDPIVGNGGDIIDIRLNIHEDFCYVNDANRNGEVLTAKGERLVKHKAPFRHPFTIRMNPEQGFEYAGIIVKHGYNLSGDSIVRNNVQWERVRISRRLFNENDEYTIPAELMDGDVEIEGLFIEKGTYVPEIPETHHTK